LEGFFFYKPRYKHFHWTLQTAFRFCWLKLELLRNHWVQTSFLIGFCFEILLENRYYQIQIHLLFHFFYLFLMFFLIFLNFCFYSFSLPFCLNFHFYLLLIYFFPLLYFIVLLIIQTIFTLLHIFSFLLFFFLLLSTNLSYILPNFLNFICLLNK